MNDDSTLRLKINGQPGEIDLKALEKSIAAISKMINAVGGRHARQCVKGLHTSSAVVDVLADPENVEAVDSGLASLQAGQAPAKEFNRQALTAVKELCAVTSMPGVTGLEFGEPDSLVIFDSSLAKNVEKALTSTRLSLGSARGTLYKFNGRDGTLTAGIEHFRTGKAIQLELKKEHVQTVLHLMQNEVVVRGLLTRDPLTNDVLSIKVKDVEEVKQKARIQSPAHEMQGILGTEWLDGMDPVELVRRERGA